MTNDARLNGVALVETLDKLGLSGQKSRAELEQLADQLDMSGTRATSLYLAGLVVAVARSGDYPLDELLAAERGEALGA